jgi:hypothetical protein
VRVNSYKTIKLFATDLVLEVEVVLQRRYEIIITRCVMAQKSDLIFVLQKYNRRKIQVAQERNVAYSRLMEMLLKLV